MTWQQPDSGLGDVLRRIEYWSLVAFAVALPIGQTPTEIALGAGLAAWALRALRDRRRPALPGALINLGLSASLVTVLCSMWNSVDGWASLDGLRRLLKCWGLFFLVLDAVDSDRSLHGVIAGCLAGLLLVSCDGMWQAVFGKDLFRGSDPAYTFGTVRRIVASFHHPASLAAYLVSFGPIALALGLRGPTRWRAPLLTLTGLTVAVLLLSRTRGGLLGFFVAMVVLAWRLCHAAPVAVAVLAAGVQALTVPKEVAAWSATMPTLFHWLTEPDRFQYWQAAINMVRAHPFVGVGVNTFVKAYPSYRVAGDQFSEVGPYAHNQYLHLAAERGLLGLLAFVTVVLGVGLALKRTVTGRQGAPHLSVLGAGLGAGLAAYLLFGGLESLLYHAREGLMFWFLAGLIVAMDGFRYRPFDSGPGYGRGALVRDIAPPEAKGRPERRPWRRLAQRQATGGVEGRRPWSSGSFDRLRIPREIPSEVEGLAGGLHRKGALSA